MRSVNFVDQGASRYVVGHVKPYDQKNEMFKRPWWNPVMMDLGQKFYHTPTMPREKAGYRLKDLSLVNAAWRLEREFAQGVRGGRMGLYDWEWDGHFGFPRVPSGLKISPDESHDITQTIKKAAAFFGASLAGICELVLIWLKKKGKPSKIEFAY